MSDCFDPKKLGADALKAPEKMELRVNTDTIPDVQAPTGVHANTLVDTAVKSHDVLVSPKFRVETYRSHELSPELIQEFADFYLEIFRNAPYNQFLFHVDDPLTPISPQTAFKNEKPYFSLEEMEAFPLPEGMMHYMDRDRTFEFTQIKLKQNATATRLVDPKTEKTVGLVFGRSAPLREIFETEEMKDPLLLSQYKNQDLLQDDEKFFRKMDYHFNVRSNDPIYYISCLAITPAFRGFDNFYTLMNNFFTSLSDDELNLFFFAEIPTEGVAADIDRATTKREVFGILGNGHSTVACELSYYGKHFLIPKKDLIGILKKYLQEKKAPFKYHPKNNSKVTVAHNTEIGRAVFACADIKAGETIAVFDGEKYEVELEKDLPSIMVNHTIQIGEKEHLHAHGQLVELINHSCDPNCGIRNYTEVFALRNIKAGEQITWDYRMTEGSNWELDECKCGTEHCAGKLGNFFTLPPKKRNEYLHQGAISEWLVKKYQLI